MSHYEEDHVSMCELFCRGLVFCLFGYRPVTNGSGYRRRDPEVGITVRVVDEQGNERSIQTTLNSFLKHLQTQHAKDAKTECEWRRGNIAEGLPPRRLQVPESLWDRVRASRRDKALWRRLHSAAEGYRRRQLALHEFLAVIDGMQDSVVALDLLRCIPQADFVEMARGRYICASDGCHALDWALCLGGQHLDLATVDAMLETWPDMCQHTDKKGRTTLHSAASGLSREPHPAILQRVLDGHPRAVEKTDERGWLPLHSALLSAHPSGVETVATLIKAYPEAVGIQDRIGWTPFHMALLGAATPLSDEQGNREENRASRSPLAVFDALLEHGGEHARESLLKKDERGLTVYHVGLCRHADDLPLLRRLLEVWPEGVQICDHDGYTALHSAVISPRANLECVRLIHQAWPEALDRRNATAHTPLHAALQAGYAPMDIVSYLLDASPPSVYTSKCPGDESLLHALLLNRHASLEVVRRVYEGHPAAIRQRMGGSRRDAPLLLPLHSALAGGAPRDVVEFLLEKWRGAVREGTVANFMALHWAVMARHTQPRASNAAQQANQVGHAGSEPDASNAAAATAGSSLVDSVPLIGGEGSNQDGGGGATLGGTNDDDDDDDDEQTGRPPSAANVEVVRLIHRAWPEALDIRNRATGCTPFLEALLSGAPADVIEYFLTESPQSLGCRGVGGMTALHAAAIGSCSVEVFCLLLQRRRGAPPPHTLWTAMAETGATPLTSALTRRASVAVVELLLQRFGEAARTKMRSGLRETPLLLAIKAGCEPEVIQRLVEAWPAGRLERDREGSLPSLYAALYPAHQRPTLHAILARRPVPSRGVMA